MSLCKTKGCLISEDFHSNLKKSAKPLSWAFSLPILSAQNSDLPHLFLKIRIKLCSPKDNAEKFYEKNILFYSYLTHDFFYNLDLSLKT